VLILIPIRFLTKVPPFVFRKLLHIVAFTCFVFMLLTSEDWQGAALASGIMALAVYPLLALLENNKRYATFFIQKSPGEVKRSLLMMFFMFAAVIAAGWGILEKPQITAASILMRWGILEKPQITAASILMWGTGDAAAALVGIPCGKHKIKTRYALKSWEGTLAMFASALLFGSAVLHLFGGIEPGRAVLAAFPAAVAGAATELFSPSEWDTVTVPVVILVALMLTIV